MTELIVSAENIAKTFCDRKRTVHALQGITFALKSGEIMGITGPDGAGKTTLLRLVCALYKPDMGYMRVLGHDSVAQSARIQSQIAYVPQKFGLYEDLCVEENIRLYATLRGMSRADCTVRMKKLLAASNIERFMQRQAGALSGGMKQKLGLCCALIARPKLIVLDEPTVGVDVLSRRELWTLLLEQVKTDGISALISSTYLDEAAYCTRTMIVYQGLQIALDTEAALTQYAAGLSYVISPENPAFARELEDRLSRHESVIFSALRGAKIHCVTPDIEQIRTFVSSLCPARCTAVQPDFEDGFMMKLSNFRKNDELAKNTAPPPCEITLFPAQNSEKPIIVRVENLLKKFGSFTAVDHISFSVRKGEVFGLLGANGAGKTTTFRMLCGLSSCDEGTLMVAGVNFRNASASARMKLGYVSQKFALYGDLNVYENLKFFAGAYNIFGSKRDARIKSVCERFDLNDHLLEAAGRLPGGYKQRLAMACALMHEPEIIFLDEPTSGADPFARKTFWQNINTLAKSGMTVILTTHYLEEAEYCDRMVIMNDGKIAAQGTPDEIRRFSPDTHQDNLSAAFMQIIALQRREQEAAGC